MTSPTPQPEQRPVVVIGAGIAGLTCAYQLKKRGHKVVVLERQPRAGGLINSVRTGPYLLEVGPNTVPDRHGTLQAMIDELDLRDQVVSPNHKANRRYIVRDGRMVALPSSPKTFITSEFLSPAAKLRLFKEPLIEPFGADDEVDESLANFVKRRFGQEVVDYALNPFVAGTYGGQPEHLSLKHTFSRLKVLEQEEGSILGGGIKRALRPKKGEIGGRAPGTGELVNFRDGESTLTNALAGALGDDLRLNVTTKQLRQRADSSWEISALQGEHEITIEAEAVVFATPAWAISEVEALDAKAQPIDLSAFGAVPYSPISVCVLAYKKADLGRPLDGFGVLIPQVEGFNTLGAIFASTIFEGRAPEDQGVMIVFIGGARAPQDAFLPEEERLRMAQEDMGKLIGLHGEPQLVIHHTWARGIPQYEVGYGRTLSQIDGIEAQHEGLLFTGNYREGISVSDAAHHAAKTAALIGELTARRQARESIAAYQANKRHKAQTRLRKSK